MSTLGRRLTRSFCDANLSPGKLYPDQTEGYVKAKGGRDSGQKSQARHQRECRQNANRKALLGMAPSQDKIHESRREGARPLDHLLIDRGSQELDLWSTDEDSSNKQRTQQWPLTSFGCGQHRQDR